MKRVLAIAAEIIIVFGLTLAIVPPVIHTTFKYGWWLGVLEIMGLIIVATIARTAIEMWKITRAKGRENSN